MKTRLIFQNSICNNIDKTIGSHLKKNSLGDYCVIITSRATNQRREFSFFTYVIILNMHIRLLNYNCVNRDIYGSSKRAYINLNNPTGFVLGFLATIKICTMPFFLFDFLMYVYVHILVVVN